MLLKRSVKRFFENLLSNFFWKEILIYISRLQNIVTKTFSIFRSWRWCTGCTCCSKCPQYNPSNLRLPPGCGGCSSWCRNPGTRTTAGRWRRPSLRTSLQPWQSRRSSRRRRASKGWCASLLFAARSPTSSCTWKL